MEKSARICVNSCGSNAPMSFFKRDSGERSYQLPEAPIAGRIKVADRIGQKDGMFKKGFEDHYFSVGRSALEAVRLAMLAAKRDDFAGSWTCPAGTGGCCGR